MSEHSHHFERSGGVNAQPVQRLQRELMNSIGRVKRNPTVGAVHDLRTAVRRLRALFNLAGRRLKPKPKAEFRDAMKWLLSQTSAAREAHVRLLTIGAIFKSLPKVTSAQRKACLTLLNRESRAASTALRQSARGTAWAARVGRINERLRKDDRLCKQLGPQALMTAITKRSRRIRRLLACKSSGIDKLHRLRIKVKHLRYGIEMRNMLVAGDHSNILTPLRRMQDHLGKLHDTEQLKRWLHRCELPQDLRSQMLKKADQLGKKYYRRYLDERKPLRRALEQYLQSF